MERLIDNQERTEILKKESLDNAKVYDEGAFDVSKLKQH